MFYSPQTTTPAREAAFTMAELLIGLVIIALLGGLLGYGLWGRLPLLRVRSGAEQVYRAMLSAKGRSAETNQRLRWRVPDNRTFHLERPAAGGWVADGPNQTLPTDVSFEEQSRLNADANLFFTPRGFFEFNAAVVKDPFLVVQNDRSGESRRIALQDSGVVEIKK